MDFISLLSCKALNNAIGDLIYKYLYGWVVTWSDDWSVIGAFSVTVIMFTIFLKVATSPLDIWQKWKKFRNSAVRTENCLCKNSVKYIKSISIRCSVLACR